MAVPVGVGAGVRDAVGVGVEVAADVAVGVGVGFGVAVAPVPSLQAIARMIIASRAGAKSDICRPICRFILHRLALWRCRRWLSLRHFHIGFALLPVYVLSIRRYDKEKQVPQMFNLGV